MKLPLFLSVCLVALVGSPLQSNAQTGKNLDIRLVGPWILFTDSNFKVGDDNVTVLVLMSPGMDNIPEEDQHAPPTFGNGDGDWVTPAGVYCVTFDGVCAPKNPSGSLNSGPYPNSYPLSVKVPGNWKWFNPTPEQAKATYLILPMPDSMSNEGEWPMEFAPASDYGNYPSPNGYSYSGTPLHSIGLHFHYSSLTPSRLDFVRCGSMTNRGIYLTPPTPRYSVFGHGRGLSEDVAGVGATLLRRRSLC
jgi:hypothetical protein